MAGNERLAYEIAAIYSGSPEIQRAFQDFGKLNAQGQRVVSQLERMGQASRQTGEKIRESRQGAAQLGMQFNQLGTQVASGTSPFTAFAQQVGDVGYALSFMDGKLGAVGRFLAGPWGAAIGLAAVALAPFIDGLFKAADGSDNLKRVQQDGAKAIDAYSNALKTLKQLQEEYSIMVAGSAAAEVELRKQHYLTAKSALESANSQVAAVLAVLNAKRAEYFLIRKQNEEALEMSAQMGGAEGLLAGYISTNRRERKKRNEVIQSEVDLQGKLALATEAQVEVQRRLNLLTSSQMSGAKGATAATARPDTSVLDRQKKIEDSLYELRLQSSYKFQQRMDEMNNEILISNKDMADGMVVITAEASEAIQRNLLGPYEEMQRSFESVGMAVSDAFKGMITGASSWRDGMKGIIQAVIDELWRMYVVQQIVGMVKGVLKDIGLPMPDVGKNANGTPSWKGGLTWVGERGPELVNIPRGAGIIPAHRASQMGGVGSGMTINVDARGAADPAAVRAQVQQGIMEAAPAIIAAAEQRTVSGLRRPRLGGVVQ